MSSRSYERLDVVEFGRREIACGDLDPLYIALNKTQMDPQAIKRFLVGYWCTYHVGQAAWLAEHEGPDYWAALDVIAANETPSPVGGRWPRGKERRHWRGQQAVLSAASLRERYDFPEEMVGYISDPAPTGRWNIGNPCSELLMRLPYAMVAERVKEHRGFGDWISFKIGDMLETCLGVPVDFTEAEVFMFADPAKAARMVMMDKMPALRDAVNEGKVRVNQSEVNRRVVAWMTKEFEGTLAPHTSNAPHARGVSLQEIETVLCKWKSHMNGHYPVGNDITEIREGLLPWAQVSTNAEDLLSVMPEEVK